MLEKFKKTFLKSNQDITVFFLLVMIKSIAYISQISKGFVIIFAICSIFASVLIIISISILFKPSVRMKFLYVINLIIGIVIIIDLNYYRYFKDVVSIFSIQNLKLLGGVTDSVFSLLKLTDILYIVDSIIIIPIIIKYKNIIINPFDIVKTKVVFTTLFLTGAIISSITIYGLSVEQPGLLSSMRNKVYITKCLGNIDYHTIDIYNFISSNIKKSKKLPQERIDKVEETIKSNENTGSNFEGIAKGKNLIVIQVESLQQFTINSKVNNQEITPNLNKWAKNCMYFDNFFCQTAAGNTSDAEFLVNNSLYPAATGAAYTLYSKNNLDSLSIELKKNGYYSAAFHGNTEVFWNRNIMYKAEGFDDFFSKDKFNYDEEIGLGLSDKSFLTQSLAKIKSFKQPFFSLVVTLTSHYPFDATDKYGTFDTGEYEGTLLGNYLKAIHYTDCQLGMFLDELKKSGIMDNSIVLLYGDHAAIPQINSSLLYQFEGEKNQDDLHWYQYQKVPFMIHFPNEQYKGVKDIYSGQIDVYPTIANLFDISSNYTLGKDLLNSSDGKVIFRNGSFTNGNVFYIASEDKFYDIKTGQKIEATEDLLNLKNKCMNEIQCSDDILNKDLLEKLSD